MTVEQINAEWGKRFLDTLNARQAAIIFGFGMSKDRKVTVFATMDLTPQELKKELKKIIAHMGG